MPGPSSKRIPNRVALKLSGEVLVGKREFGIDVEALARVAGDVVDAHNLGFQMCVIIGGGNIFRGVKVADRGIDRISADSMGMMATVINSLALRSAIESLGVNTRVMSSIAMQQICEPFLYRRARRHLDKGRIVVCAAGTGNPYFSTDTAAVLRASELNCGVLLKGTKVNGVYDRDPKTHKNAKLIDRLDYDQALGSNLRIMDAAAFALSRESKMPILVFSILEKGNLSKVLKKQGTFSQISDNTELNALDPIKPIPRTI